ncbi:uncharacterized protein LOC142981959 [Anticarsia gemmatalis]|uniref:uncharacterized protein LOC142981959 n=1 Tax=Anticarsia gemmatalis TaxID=129554 RepID=UPI003F76EB0D
MFFTHTVLVFILSCVLGDAYIEKLSPRLQKKYEELCNTLPADPYFRESAIVDSTWRAYFVWNEDMYDKCIDIVFKLPNPLLIKTIQTRMRKYMKKEPAWYNATLYMTINSYRGILLIPDSDKRLGRFIQVPNLVRGSYDIAPEKKSMQLYKATFKLLYLGWYMLFCDCSKGVTFILARRDRKVSPKVLEAIADSYDYGKGPYPTCLDPDWND